ncbi:MAG: hypothetical protein ABIT01_11005 [Thermoanaerobaculia bacterium]
MEKTGKPDNTRPIRSISPRPIQPTRSSTTVPDLFVEGDKKVSLIEADKPMGRTPEQIRQELLKRRKQAGSEKLREESEIAEGFARVRKTTLYIIGVMMVAFGFWRIHVVYEGKWPLMLTWGVMAVAMMAGFGWLFWYLDNSD